MSVDEDGYSEYFLKIAKVFCNKGTFVGGKRWTPDIEEEERLLLSLNKYQDLVSLSRSRFSFFIKDVLPYLAIGFFLSGFTMIFVLFLPVSSLVTFFYTYEFMDTGSFVVAILLSTFTVFGYKIRPVIEKRKKMLKAARCFVGGEISLERFDNTYEALKAIYSDTE